jgi:hypothetical protein
LTLVLVCFFGARTAAGFRGALGAAAFLAVSAAAFSSALLTMSLTLVGPGSGWDEISLVFARMKIK